MVSIVGIITFLIVFQLVLFTIVALPVCEKYYGSERDIWLKGDTTSVSFPLQFIAVYSFAPVSFILRSNLVVGNLFVTPKSSLAGENGKQMKRTSAPFTSFFDNAHFTAYWAQHKLQVLPVQLYQFCFQRNLTNFSHKKIAIQRDSEIQPLFKHEFQNLLAKNKVKKFPFPNHSYIYIKGKYKLIAMYNFWNHLPMLQYVYDAVKPAPPIDKFVKAVLKTLSDSFISMHLRLDEEAFPSYWIDAYYESSESSQVVTNQEKQLTTTARFNHNDDAAGKRNDSIPTKKMAPVDSKEKKNPQAELKKFFSYLKSFPCIDDMPRMDGLLIDPPTIYITIDDQSRSTPSSSSSATTNDNNDAEKKLEIIIQELSKFGFINIVTRQMLIEQYLGFSESSQSSSSSSAASTTSNKIKINKAAVKSQEKGVQHSKIVRSRKPAVLTDLALFRIFNKEQLQYADLLISQASSCFIPSELPSFTSYLIKRVKALASKKRETYQSINETTYGAHWKYREWGF
jgi:hypothetical protein